MIDKNIKIANINGNILCICYYIIGTTDLMNLEISLLSQIKYTNIINYSVLLFTPNNNLYDSVRTLYKDLIGEKNIIKVDSLLLSTELISVHPEVVKYKIGIIYKPNVVIDSTFDYINLINYHTQYPMVFLSNEGNNNFSESFNNMVKNSFSNSLQLSINNIKDVIFNCYCSRVNRANKFLELSKSNLINTNVLSFFTRFTKSPTFHDYIINTLYNGIRCSDILFKCYSDSKGYVFQSISSTGLKLKTL